jgi:hypothetical protein
MERYCHFAPESSQYCRRHAIAQQNTKEESDPIHDMAPTFNCNDVRIILSLIIIAFATTQDNNNNNNMLHPHFR